MGASTASWRTLVALLLVAAVFAAAQDEEEAPEAPDLDEGQSCDAGSGVRGTCRSIRVCASAIAELRNGTHPRLCRYEGRKPIVCCPPLQPQPQPQSAPDSGDHSGDSALAATAFDSGDSPPTSASTALLADLDSGGGPPSEAEASPAATTETSPGPEPGQEAGPAPGADAWTVAAQKCDEYKRLAVDGRRGARSVLPGPGGKGVKQCAKPGNLLAAAGSGVPWPSLALLQEFPHMVLVGYGEGSSIDYACVGALIAPDTVLTAAHCLSSGGVPAGWVLPGVLSSAVADDAAGPQLTAVAERTAHPDGDIALLRLEQAVNVDGYVRPACLQTESIPSGPAMDPAMGPASEDVEHQDLLIAGWGTTEDDSGISADFLQKAAVRGADCANGSAAADGGAVLCAGGPGRQACHDDTKQNVTEAVLQRPLDAGRGDAYCMYAVVGLSLAGTGGNGCGEAPGVFTAVRHYVPWIVATAWP